MSEAARTRSGGMGIAVLRGICAGLLLALLAHFLSPAVMGNFRVVVAGEVYRARQPSEGDLERMIARHGIRTVVNLRGCCPSQPWYQRELSTTAHLGVQQEDLSFSAGRLPRASGVRQLIEILDRCEYPILLHCRQGADRTGLASVIVLLLREDVPYEQARLQLGLPTCHVGLGRTAWIGEFFRLYQNWLHEQGVEHSAQRFRHWALKCYCPGGALARYEIRQPGFDGVLRAKTVPPRRSQQFGVPVRIHNLSNTVWSFRPGRTEGLYVAYELRHADSVMENAGRAGLVHRDVPPGGFLDVIIPLHARVPGRYRLLIDVHDGRQGTFYQLGSELGVFEVEVTQEK